MSVAYSVLSVEALHKQALSIRRSQTVLNWELAMCLRALEKAGAFARLECSSVEMYARTRLNMNPHKASELLRAARRLETAPMMSEAFRRGDLTWSKVREVTRHVTPETDAEMTTWALAHTAEEIQRCMVVSPRRFHREQKNTGATVTGAGDALLDIGGLPGSPEIAPPGPLPISPTGPVASPTQTAPAELCLTPESIAGPLPEPPAQEGTSSGVGPVALPAAAPVDNGANAASIGMPDSLAKKRLIGVMVYIDPEDYALFEKAKAKVRAKLGKRVPVSVVVKELCIRYLTTGSAHSNLKHQVHVHVDTQAGAAWVETDRGPLAVATPTAVEGFTGKLGDTPTAVGSSSGKLGETPNTVGSSSGKRRETPNTVESSSGKRRETPNTVGSSSGKRRETPNTVGSSSGKFGRTDASGSTERNKGRAEPGGESSRPPAGKPSRRIPTALLRQVVRRAQGCCETPGCRKTTNLQVHHSNPFCDSPEHRLEDLILLCGDCHHVTHIDDFESKTLWRYAKALRSRNRQPVRAST